MRWSTPWRSPREERPLPSQIRESSRQNAPPKAIMWPSLYGCDQERRRGRHKGDPNVLETSNLCSCASLPPAITVERGPNGRQSKESVAHVCLKRVKEVQGPEGQPEGGNREVEHRTRQVGRDVGARLGQVKGDSCAKGPRDPPRVEAECRRKGIIPAQSSAA